MNGERLWSDTRAAARRKRNSRRRHREIMRVAKTGADAQEIAKKLCLSISVVQKTLRRGKRKR